MTEKPILFSTPMVRAILEGRKDQTRRICKPQPVYDEDSGHVFIGNVMFDIHDGWDIPMYLKDTARWEVGDILWVRETWYLSDFNEELLFGTKWLFKADVPDANHHLFKWKPSIFMPKLACRIKLEVIDIKAQRLHDITLTDCILEGCSHNGLVHDGFATYIDIWESINGKGSWVLNPWVWVIDFKRIR